MSGVKVVLDVHEPVELEQFLQDIPEVDDVMLAALDAADISINGVGFERKTIGDYVASMQDDRLEAQCEKLHSYDTAYILVEGALVDTEGFKHSGMDPAAIRGHMASMTAREEYHVRAVLPCSNLALLADYAVRLARKHTEEPTSQFLPTGSVAFDEPTGMRMWGCVPGVGPELARRIFEAFGSPVAFTERFNSPVSDPVGALMAIDRVGEKKAEQIWEEVSKG